MLINASQLSLTAKAFMLFKVLGNKDGLTAQHSLNVACIMKTLVTHFIKTELGGEEAFIAGLLHDIGKLKMPSYVFKNHIITHEKEIKVIQQHPKYSKQILEGYSFDPLIVSAAYQHHERLDGSGYPSGLTAFEISSTARLLGIVDSFSAIKEDRLYRKGVESNKAIELLLEKQGIYDVDMLSIFIKNINHILICSKLEVDGYKRWVSKIKVGGFIRNEK